MAIGRVGLLGAAQITAGTGTWIQVYLCPTGYSATIEINFATTGTVATTYSWAISAQPATPNPGEIRETSSPLYPGSPAPITTSIGAGQSVFCQSATGGLNAIVNGFEESPT